MSTTVLVLYYSKHGSVARMAEQVALGVDSVSSCEACLRTLAPVSPVSEQVAAAIPDSGPPFAELADFETCDGLVVGSPGYFGNMAAPVKHFFDRTSPLWLAGAMIGKPAGVFTATSTQHGGQETVLTSMILPLLHHGMLVTGIPYSEPALHRTAGGGSPYGASHVAGERGRALSADEGEACRALGRRIAELARRLRRD